MLKRCVLTVVGIMLIGLVGVVAPETSHAQGNCQSGGVSFNGRYAGAQGTSGCPPQTGTGVHTPTYQELYEQSVIKYKQCMAASVPTFEMFGVPINCDYLPDPPQGTGSGLTSEDVALIAASRLEIPDLTLEMGPAPSLNPWNTAVVGVNYWFYAKGPVSIPQTGQTVGPVSAHLSARITSLTIHTNANQSGAPVLRCQGPGIPWRKNTPLSKKSPTCGHSYTQPTTAAIRATATWTVFWEVNGQTGTLALASRTTLTVPVKELQSVKR